MSANAGRPDLDQLVRAKHIPGDEPVFLLRARDPAAAAAVRAWATSAHLQGVPIAVIEEALQQADAFDAWPQKRLPEADHLAEHEAKQLEYQFSRRAWRARGDAGDEAALILAERRGWDAAMAQVRLEAIARPAEAIAGDVVPLDQEAARG